MNEGEKSRNRGFGFGRFIYLCSTVQCAVAGIILAALLIIKSFFPAIFGEIKEFYSREFTATTSVSEVLGDEKP